MWHCGRMWDCRGRLVHGQCSPCSEVVGKFRMLRLRLYVDDCRLACTGTPEDVAVCLAKATSLWVQGLSDEGGVINAKKSITLGFSARVFVLVAPQNFGKFGSWLCVWDLPMGGFSSLVAGSGSALRVVSHSSLPVVGRGRGWVSALRRRTWVLAVGGSPTPRRRPLVLAVGGFPPFVAGRGSWAWVGPHPPSPAVGPGRGCASVCSRRPWVPLLHVAAGRGSRCTLVLPAVGPVASCRRRPCVFVCHAGSSFFSLHFTPLQPLCAGIW